MKLQNLLISLFEQLVQGVIMAISSCISLSNQTSPFNINETGTHGTLEFPVAIYRDDITENLVNWHWHTEIEIGYVEEGVVLLECGNRKYTLTPGNLFFINSNVLHAINNQHKGKAAVFRSIAFDGSLISSNTESVFYKKYLSPVIHNTHFRDFIWKADSEYFAILIRIDKTAVESNQSINLLLEDRAQVILNYIHANYPKNITLDNLAITANVSKSEVLRCFKAIINTSPIKYLKNFRLQNAAYMLKKSAYSIQTIYELCGFDNNSYFSKSFNEQYHCSPREYRGL